MKAAERNAERAAEIARDTRREPIQRALLSLFRRQVRRIGVLAPAAANDPVWQARVGAFQQALALLGWIIGRNVLIERRKRLNSAR